MFDFVRVSCCVPSVAVANPQENAKQIIKKIREAEAKKANFALFPELSLSGYTCGDLFFQEQLLIGVKKALKEILLETKSRDLTVILGAPLMLFGKLYNCAVVIYKGRILGIVPKTCLPNYNEFSEKRWFSGANDLKKSSMRFSQLFMEKEGEDYTISLGNTLVFKAENGVTFGVELCEDLWMPVPPSTQLSFSGAEVIFNLAASNETVGKRAFRIDAARLQSAKCICGYVCASAGTDESTSDLIFSGHSFIAENGSVLLENETLLGNDYCITTDLDLGKVRADRIRRKPELGEGVSFSSDVVEVSVAHAPESDGAYIPLRKLPFVPPEKEARLARCLEIFAMQVAALKKRLSVTGGKAVIGVSGGLDSTLALLVTAEAVKELSLPMSNILAVTMPCFGTTDRTLNNALSLMKSLGVTAKNISIKEACEVHLKDIGHDINVHDVTYENAQARERTQVLMDLSNAFGGIVIGTGDLSELALGWCTYNGDHMSMYAVNAGIPKTLVCEIVESVKEVNLFSDSGLYLNDILSTPISPELLPPDETGRITQKTEDLVGPYSLHDFFLYYALRYGFGPKKIYHLAKRAFSDEFPEGEILKWLKTFYRRFFSQQFKRSSMPEGVKIGSVGLSPRGDFKMPGDSQSAVWLSELETLR